MYFDYADLIKPPKSARLCYQSDFVTLFFKNLFSSVCAAHVLRGVKASSWSMVNLRGITS